MTSPLAAPVRYNSGLTNLACGRGSLRFTEGTQLTRGIEPERRGLISGYTLVEEVHRGHKRVVYRALRAADHLPVVIKMVVGDLVSEKDVARLTREFEILKRVEIDGVVKAIALQKHAPPALVMEDVHGESLRNLIDSDRVGLKTFLPPACRLCEALGELHRQGITHRDITPNNIVLNVSTGQVRLIDFGIAVEHHAREARNRGIRIGWKARSRTSPPSRPAA